MSRRTAIIEREKRVQNSTHQADLIGIETIDKMNAAGVGAGTAAITLALLGFNSLKQALPEVQVNFLALAEQKIAEHRKRLEEEGHAVDLLWPELNQEEDV